MATVIDSLIVSLGLDATKFDKGQKDAVKQLKNIEDAAKKSGNQLDKSGKQAADSFGKLKRELLTVAALFVSIQGIKHFVVGNIEAAAGLDRMSKNLNVNARELAAWKLAAEAAGDSSEAMMAAIQQSQTEMAKFGRGEDVGNLLQNKVHITENMSATDLMGAKFQAVQDMHDWMIKLGKGETFAKGQAMLTAQNIGVGGVMNSAMKGNQGWDELMKSAQALAKEQAELAPAAERMRLAFNKIGNELEVVGIQVLEHFMKPLETFANYLTSPGFKKDLEEFSSLIGNMVDALQDGLKALGYDNKKFTLQQPAWAKAVTYALDGDRAEKDPGLLTKLGRGTGLLPTPHEDMGAMQKRIQAMGYTTNQASAIVGNMQQESGLNPYASNWKGGEEHYGLFQWGGDRLKALRAKYGAQPGTVDQLAFFKQEMASSKYKNLWSGTNDSLVGNVDAFDKGFEISGGRELVQRFKFAQQASDLAAKSQGSTGTTNVTNITGPISVTTDAKNVDSLTEDINKRITNSRSAMAKTGMPG